MLYLKPKLSEIDREEKDGITTIIYFDEYYRVHKFEYSRDYSYIATFDEIDEPSLTQYRIVMELTCDQRSN
jgi:hypothetical protein